MTVQTWLEVNTGACMVAMPQDDYQRLMDAHYDQLSILHLQLAYLLTFRDEVVRLASERHQNAAALRARLLRSTFDVNARCASIPGASPDRADGE